MRVYIFRNFYLFVCLSCWSSVCPSRESLNAHMLNSTSDIFLLWVEQLYLSLSRVEGWDCVYSEVGRRLGEVREEGEERMSPGFVLTAVWMTPRISIAHYSFEVSKCLWKLLVKFSHLYITLVEEDSLLSVLFSLLSLIEVGPQSASIEPSPSHVNVGMVAPDEPWRGRESEGFLIPGIIHLKINK